MKLVLHIFTFTLLLANCSGISSQIKRVYAKELKSLLTKHGRPTPAKGHEFAEIPGPKCKQSKIGIVGAGPSGTHMAWLLKRAGYSDITILEKTDRVGGKSENYFYRGVTQYVSTVVIPPDYRLLRY